MDKEILALVSQFLETQQSAIKPNEIINVNLSLSAAELKEVGVLLNKLRSQNA